MNIMDLVDDEIFDNLEWKYIERDEIPGLMQGYTIVGMEPSGFPPDLDGLLICLKSKENELFLLDIHHDFEMVTTKNGREYPKTILLVSTAKLPQKTE